MYVHRALEENNCIYVVLGGFLTQQPWDKSWSIGGAGWDPLHTLFNTYLVHKVVDVAKYTRSLSSSLTKFPEVIAIYSWET